MKIAVVGTGFGERVVAPVFDATDGCEVVEVVSARDEAAVRSVVGRADVDLVAVHSPPFLHAMHAQLALEAGKAVLCDKPFAMHSEEAASLLVAAEAAGVVHLVNFEFRHAPGRRQVRDLVRDGAIGAVEHVQWTAHSAGSRTPLRWFGWLFDRAYGGGWVGAWGSHAVDMIRWAFGEVTDVVAQRRIDVPQRPDRHGDLYECTAEDGLTAALTLERGVTVAIDSTFVASVDRPGRITVFGSEGVLESVADREVRLMRDDGTRDVIAFDAGERDPHLEPMRAWAEVVRDAVHDGVAPHDAPTFADGLACDRVLDRLRAAPCVVKPAAG